MSMRILVCFLATLAIVVLIGCGKKKSDDAGAASTPVTASFLSADDFSAPTALKTQTQTDVATALQKNSNVYDNRPESTSAATASTTCLNNLIGTAVVTATTSTLKVGAQFDTAGCLSQSI